MQDLDYNHPIRNFVEQRLLANVDTRLNGMGKRVVRDPYNPFPKIPRSENFPDEFVYVGGLTPILLETDRKHLNCNTAYSPVPVPSTPKETRP